MTKDKIWEDDNIILSKDKKKIPKKQDDSRKRN